jgi:hypothetical protein
MISVGDVYRRMGDMHTTLRAILAELERLNGSNSKQIRDFSKAGRTKRSE